jgi:Ca2+/H+ antiporter, TMEM165/GDT1 family
MQKKRKRFWFIPFIIIGIIALLSAAVMLLWNGVVTDVFSIKKISWAQALGLFVLCKILFGSFRFGPPSFRRGGAWRNKLMNLSPEERDRFKEEWQKRCADDQQKNE